MSEIDFNKLPNFMLIGSPKCGTSSLHSILGQHPEIYTTSHKEPHFFDRDVYTNGLLWYQDKYFDGAEKYPQRGESTPNYLTFGYRVAPRLKESYGDRELRFIAIFRDPVKRAYSEYWFRNRRYKEQETFEDALKSEFRGDRDLWHSYYQTGCYATLLNTFFEYFPRERFHFLLLEDLIENLDGTMKELARFLGVRDGFHFTSVTENQSFVIKNKRLMKFMKDPSDPFHKIGKIISNFLPKKQVRGIKKIVFKNNLRTEKYSQIDKQIEADLRERYFGEIKKLEEIMRRDLSAWYTK